MDPDIQTVTRRFVAADGRDVEQAVDLRTVTVGERGWLLLHAEVCPIADLDPTVALAAATSLAVGGLCTANGAYHVQHSVPMSSANDDIELVIDMLAHEAARLRTHSLAPRRDSLFSYLAE